MTGSRGAGARTLLLGTDAPFSAAVFAGLVQSGIDVVAVGVDGDHPFTPLFSAHSHGHRETLLSLSAARGVPSRAIPDPAAPETRDWLDAQRPDFILVACFSRRLPDTLCNRAARACLNLHPSLLPRYRGPAPLFWQLRAGRTDSGITLHHVSPVVDAGPIVAQAPVALGGGLDGAALEERFAEAGVELFCRMLEVSPSGRPEGVAQREAEACRQSAPAAEDFRIDPGWSAAHAYAFMRGTAHLGMPYPVAIEGREFLLREALGRVPAGSLEAPMERVDGMLRIRCRVGVLEAALA